MANDYINGTGLKHLWNKCVTLFVQKSALKDYAKQESVDELNNNLSDNYLTTTEIEERFGNLNTTEDIFLVEAELDPTDNFNVISISKTYQEMAEALNLKKDVKILASISLGDDNYAYFIGEVVIYRPSFGTIEFSMVADTDLGEGESVYHFRITVTSENSITMIIKQISKEEGQSSVSPTVQIESITGGHRIIITDVNGNHSFDVFDGEKGNDGISASHSWNGTVLTIASASGTSSANLKGEKGDKGDKGDDGHTPVKGTDYFTNSDKAELVDSVLNALPTWQGGSY